MPMKLPEPPEIVPLFPLRQHVLLPGVPRPYHVFEPRYRALVEDLLAREEGRRFLCIPCLEDVADHELEGAPPFHPVASLGLMVAHETLATGRFNIVVYGLQRVRLEETDSDALYRRARVTLLEDQPAPPGFSLDDSVEVLSQLLTRLLAALPAMEGRQTRILREREDPQLFVYRLAAMLLSEHREALRFLQFERADQRVEMLYEVLMGAISAWEGAGPSELS